MKVIKVVLDPSLYSFFFFSGESYVLYLSDRRGAANSYLTYVVSLLIRRSGEDFLNFSNETRQVKSRFNLSNFYKVRFFKNFFETGSCSVA